MSEIMLYGEFLLKICNKYSLPVLSEEQGRYSHNCLLIRYSCLILYYTTYIKLCIHKQLQNYRWDERQRRKPHLDQRKKVLNICHKVKVSFILFILSFTLTPFALLANTQIEKKVLAHPTVCLAFRMTMCSNTGKIPFIPFALNYKSRQLLVRTLIQCPLFISCLSSLQRVFISIASPKPFNSHQKIGGKS